MSYILELNLREEINAADWLVVDTPAETMRVSAGALSAWIGGVKTVNNLAPEAGNVNLTPDQISDIASGKKFVTQEEKNRIALIRNAGSGSLFLSDDGTYKAPAASAGGLWGTISGDITTQTDLYNLFEDVWNDVSLLNTRLAGKQDTLGFQPEDSAKKGQPGGYVPLGTDSKIAASYFPEGIGGGNTLYRSVFRFDSDMFTEDEALFRGTMRDLSMFHNFQITIMFQARLERQSYGSSMNISELQNWINSWVTGNTMSGTIFFIKAVARYSATENYGGLTECILYYKN